MSRLKIKQAIDQPDLVQSMNDPLAIIKNSLFYLELKMQDMDGKSKKHFGIIKQEINRLQRIISKLVNRKRY
ncbi:hypothetical protein GF325_06280 [Candidatus Bathyarchaeota archaeon]|nr:hypothetical protein [Candidatus Bathyarchaeota archaeon]